MGAIARPESSQKALWPRGVSRPRVVPMRSLVAERGAYAERRRLLPVMAGQGPLPERPRTRADCERVPRPCPYVGCKHNLYLDVTRSGGIRLAFPGREPADMPAAGSCALDVAEEGGVSLRQIGRLMGYTRARIGQLLDDALEHLRASREEE